MSADNPPRGYPESWTSSIGDLTGCVSLNVAGHATTIDITTNQLEQVYFPLLSLLSRLARPDRRVLAGLAGIPGSGKSTVGGALAHVANVVLPPDHLAVVGMDGWHWPNRILDQRTTTDTAGRPIPLRQRKGGPESFDVANLVASLHKLQGSSSSVPLPVYDRQQHGPVSDALVVPPETRIVLVEGNYLLCDDPPWNDVSALLHPKLYLECDPEIAWQRVIARHVRGGCTEGQALAKYENNDRLNTDIVLGTAFRADVRIQLSESPQLLRLDEDPAAG